LECVSTKRSIIRLTAAEKRAKVVDARAAGNTWARCAEISGYSSPESAMRAFNTACAMMPQQSLDELIAGETARLESCDQVLADIIVSPPIKTTSIGRTQYDVRTCTCDTKASTTRDHAEGCTVQPVLDQHAVISAIKERRLVGESLRRMRGADRPQTQTPDDMALAEEATAYLRAVADRNRQLTAQADHLTARLRMYEPLLAIDPPRADQGTSDQGDEDPVHGLTWLAETLAG
jgi:hypothetical protein